MEGGNFSSLLGEVREIGSLLSEEFCLYSLYMVCQALNELHKKNIVFGNLEPQNVQMKPNGDIKLTNSSN